ncbi:MAG TPA: metallophosphoesterase [Candidatus Nanoarchaeia archaeon]|nr:metallophosphoesterase [Candidatus Nanoarchaeia archaeon]
MEKKFRILAASDVHGDSDKFISLAEKAEKEKVDLVLLCGDIFGWNETKNIIKPFKEKNKPVLVIPGNHENFQDLNSLTAYYGIKNIHGSSAIYKEVGIFGAGGADLAPGFITDKDLSKALNKAHKGLEMINKKILVTHMHPAGSKSEFSGFLGSEAVRQAIEKFKPTFAIHGHIHEAAGLEEMWGNTTIINVGRNGRIFEI